MDDAADHTAIIHPRLAAHVLGQMRLDLPPLFIAQPKTDCAASSPLRINRDSESATDSASNDFIGFSF
jgi:hypothetical protein